MSSCLRNNFETFKNNVVFKSFNEQIFLGNVSVNLQKQMLHSVLGYSEVITNVKYATVTTMPLELRVEDERIESDNTQEVEDGAYIGTALDTFCCIL